MNLLAVETAAACLGIGACGYLIGRLHARPANPRPGYLPIPMAAAVDNWVGYPYDQQRRPDEGTR